MGRNNQDSGFEEYRRERNKHRLKSGPRRDLGCNARVLKELEQVELQEARNQQLTREVHDFFTDATRTAAEIVQKVSLDKVHQIEDQLSEEMAEFLAETIRRAQEFVSLIQLTANPDLAETEVVPNMQNLVGQTLDQFRAEGTAQLSDKHLGLDPFAKELEMAETDNQPEPEPEVAPEPELSELPELTEIEPMIDPIEELTTAPVAAAEPVATPEPEIIHESSMDDHLVATVEPESAAPAPGTAPWFLRLKDDPEKLKTSLKVLVRTGMMTKEEALDIYRNTLTG